MVKKKKGKSKAKSGRQPAAAVTPPETTPPDPRGTEEVNIVTPLVIEEAVPLDPGLVVQQDGPRDSGETKSGDETKAPESADILVTEETSKTNDSSESREGTTLVMNPKTSPKLSLIHI